MATKRYYPVVREFMISAGPFANTLVDTARFLSAENRRLYRFGRTYNTKVELRPDWTGGTIEVFALQNNYDLHQAYKMAFQVYLDNTKEERSMLGKQVARWEDFRVSHGLTVPLNSARPVHFTMAGGHVVDNGGEFNLSEITDTAQVARTFTLGAGSATTYGILAEYQKASLTSDSPEFTNTDVPYANVTNLNDANTSQALQENGDEPPYQDQADATAVWRRVGVLGMNANGVQSLSTGYFEAPLGLVLLVGFLETSEDYSCTLTVQAGSYKGVSGMSMGDPVLQADKSLKVV